MSGILISLAQINIQHGSPSNNLSKALSFINLAKENQTSIILFPELWTSGYDLEHGQVHARSNLEIIQELKIQAKTCNMAIGGSYLLERNGRIFNTFVLLLPDGSECSYSKIHLFRLMDEHKHLHQGESIQAFDLPWAKTGLSICYDLRFPEFFRFYALNQVKIIFLAAEWPEERIAHWEHLIRARAIENQFFMAAVNSTGSTGKERFGGNSAVINPWGETISGLPDKEEGLAHARMELEQVENTRTAIPVFKDRRTDLY